MQDSQPRFWPLAAKTVVCHTITYFVMGALAFHFLHYANFLNDPKSGMRPTTSIWILLGVPLQVFRGVLFAAVFYPLRERLFGRQNRGIKGGWMLMAWMLIALGILGTFAAPPGSIEGFIYTTTPIAAQFSGYLEIVTQALLLSALLCYWVNHPEKKWLSWLLSILYVLCAGLPMLALLAPKK